MSVGSRFRRCKNRGFPLRARPSAGASSSPAAILSIRRKFCQSGGNFVNPVEVCDEAIGQWRQLPCSLPRDPGLSQMGSALM